MRPERFRGIALLVAAIVSEVLGTLLLPLSAGFSRPAAGLGVLVGCGVSIVLFSRALRHGLTLGIAYGTLTGCGLASATLLGAVLLGQPLAAVQAVGLVLILAGAAALQSPAPTVRP